MTHPESNPGASGTEPREVPAGTAPPSAACACPEIAGSHRAAALAALRTDGLAIGECIRTLAVPNDDPYVTAAREAIRWDDDVEIDDETTTSVGDGGAWVLAWLWVSDHQAGVLSHSEMLEELAEHAGQALAAVHGLDKETFALRENQLLWLEELVTHHAEEIDAITSVRPTAEPGAILWVDETGSALWFVPSEALLHLLGLARKAGLAPKLAEHCERFCAQYGRTLDAVLTVIPLG